MAEATAPHPDAAPSPPRPARDADKAVRILAKSLYKDLRSQGFDQRHVVALAAELIGQVTADGDNR